MKNEQRQNWLPLWVDSWLFGSTRIELKPEERAIWVDLLALGAKDNGYIRAGVNIPYPIRQMAGLLMVEEELLQRTIDLCVQTEKLEVQESGILKITNWDKYQLSDRYRRRLKSGIGKPDKKDSSAKTEQCAEKSADSSVEKEPYNIRREENRGEEKRREEIKSLFLVFWNKYPKKIGMKEAERHFKASVKTDKDVDAITQALKNYLESARVKKGIIQDAKTWFNNWPDWVTFQEKLCPKCKNTGKYTSSSGYSVFCECPIGKANEKENKKGFSATL